MIATRVEGEALAGMGKRRRARRDQGAGRKGGNTLLPAFKVKTHKVVRRRVCFLARFSTLATSSGSSDAGP